MFFSFSLAVVDDILVQLSICPVLSIFISVYFYNINILRHFEVAAVTISVVYGYYGYISKKVSLECPCSDSEAAFTCN